MANSLAQDTDLDLLSVAVGGSTVEITPTITTGVKIADYVVDDVPGSLYTPQYNAGTGININNNTISVDGDITPYSGSNYIDITNHTVSVVTPRKLVVDSTLYKSVNTATNELHIGGNYTEGTGIDIDDNIISVTGDIIPYSGSSGISVSNHNISITGNVGSLFEAVYGQTSYSDITAAIADKKIVYCRVSPTGASRMAFLAYISNSNVEFQYYRSLNQHTSANQGDEVYVYTCSSNNTWATTTRKTYTKIAAGSGLGVDYSNETLTISSNGSANYATSAGSANYADAAILADSAQRAQSAYNVRVYGTDANLYYDIPLYLDVSSELHVDNNNKLLYNPSTNILSASNIIVDNITANSISATTFSGNLSGIANSAISAEKAASATSALTAGIVDVTQTTTNTWFNIPLYSAGTKKMYVDNDYQLRYNPSSNILSATNISVNAISATSISGPVITGASITSTISSGTKIADYTINNVTGSLYAPSIQLTRNVFDYNIATIEHQITSTDITNKSFSENVDFSWYNSWSSSGIITSVPIITIDISTMQGIGVGSKLSYILSDGGTSYIQGIGELTNLGLFIVRPLDPLDTYSNTLSLLIGNIDNNFSVGDTIYIYVKINCIKLV